MRIGRTIYRRIIKEMSANTNMTYTCPDCGTPLRQIDSREGKEAWACPVALRAQQLGILGQPGRKHKECMIYGVRRKEEPKDASPAR